MKYRANVGGGVVEAQKIKDYRFDAKAQQHYLLLDDDTRRPQPVLHGMKPMIGDWYVETSTGTTRLRDGSQYEERSAAAIIKAVDFDITYTAVPEDRSAAHRVLEAPYSLTAEPQPQDPYTVFVMPDQVGPMQETINADDVVVEPADAYVSFDPPVPVTATVILPEGAPKIRRIQVESVDDIVNTESGATLTPEMLALGKELADRVEETDKILTASMTGHTPEEVEEMLKQSLPKIVPDIIGDDVVEEEPTEETQAHAKETIAAYTEIEMVDNQTADGE